MFIKGKVLSTQTTLLTKKKPCLTSGGFAYEVHLHWLVGRVKFAEVIYSRGWAFLLYLCAPNTPSSRWVPPTLGGWFPVRPSPTQGFRRSLSEVVVADTTVAWLPPKTCPRGPLPRTPRLPDPAGKAPLYSWRARMLRDPFFSCSGKMDGSCERRRNIDIRIYFSRRFKIHPQIHCAELEVCDFSGDARLTRIKAQWPPPRWVGGSRPHFGPAKARAKK